jgi:hypothetical protein
MELARIAYDQILADAKLTEKEVDYVATTGEGEGVPFHTGHFYSMTTHARGGVFLEIKQGPYDPATAAEFASWSPAEGDASVARFLEWVRSARPGQAAPR